MKKTKLVNFRATPDEKERWDRLLKHGGRDASDVCRAALNRVADRIEKKGAPIDNAV